MCKKEEEETKGLKMGQGVRIPTFGNLSSFAMSSFVNYLKLLQNAFMHLFNTQWNL
jgi:hypothetical protein